ncbi:hypothetical protein [Streptomyces sp. NPDC127066]|uniref:hypothetical protein n=1 Tax=Streptomyces sp. NPDC127066 TaxID=3347125 RepID=UPI0036585958
MIPDRAVPRVPLGGGLPGADVRTPLPHMVGDGFEHLVLSVPAAGPRTLTPERARTARSAHRTPTASAFPD